MKYIATAFLVFMLGGCAAPKQVVIEKITPVFAPDTLTKDCHKTTKKEINPTGMLTNAELGILSKGLQIDIDACNADKAALRLWKANAVNKGD